MKNYLKVFISVACLFLLTVHGFSQRGRLSFYFNAAIYFPVQENLDTGYGSGIGTLLSLNRNVSLVLEWKYGSHSVIKEEGKLLNGTLYVTPLLASLRYDFRKDSRFSPYVFLGGGIIFCDFRLSKEGDISEANVADQDVINGFGVYGGLGGSFKISSQFSIFVEGVYLHRKTTAETRYYLSLPLDEFPVNLSSFCIAVGIKYSYY